MLERWHNFLFNDVFQGVQLSWLNFAVFEQNSLECATLNDVRFTQMKFTLKTKIERFLRIKHIVYVQVLIC